MRNSFLFVIVAIFFLLFSPVTATIIVGQNTTIDPNLTWGVYHYDTCSVWNLNLHEIPNEDVWEWACQQASQGTSSIDGKKLYVMLDVPSPPPVDPLVGYNILSIERESEAWGWLYEPVDIQGKTVEEVEGLTYILDYDLTYDLTVEGGGNLRNWENCGIVLDVNWGDLYIASVETPGEVGLNDCLEETAGGSHECIFFPNVTSIKTTRHLNEVKYFSPFYEDGMGLVEEVLFLDLWANAESIPEERGGSDHRAEGTVTVSNITITWPSDVKPQFSFYPRNPDPGEVIVFDASDSQQFGNPVEYIWFFGGWQNRVEGMIVEYTFDEPGVYPVYLYVIDDRDYWYYTTQNITVGSPEFCTGTVEFLLQNYDDINGWVSIVVTDDDLNQNPRISEEVVVTLQSFDTDTYGGSSYRQIGEKEVYLAEMGTNSNTFTNFVMFSPTGTDPLGINVSSYLPGYFKAIYIDKIDATGDTNVERNATATYYFAAKVKGRVWDMDTSAALGVSDIHPVTGAEVVMTKPGELLGGKRYTNENGFFEFDQVSPGTYNIDVTIRDQNGLIERTYSRQVEVRSAQTTWVEFPEHILELMKMEYKTKASQDYVTLRQEYVKALATEVILNASTSALRAFLSIWGFLCDPVTLIDVIAFYGEFGGDQLFARVEQSYEDQAWMAIEILGAIADDPPDSGYSEIFQLELPDPITIPPDYSGMMPSSYVNLANLLADQNAIDRAILVSFERYQGALEAGKPEYMELQLDAIQQYAGSMQEKEAQIQLAIQVVIDEVEANDQLYGDSLRSLQQRLASEGFTVEEEQALRDLGFTRLDLDTYREFLLSLDSDRVIQGLQDMDNVSQSRAESALSLSEHAGEILNYLEVTPYEEIHFYPGWNFVSIPKSLSEGNNTADIFSTIDTGGKPIFSYTSENSQWNLIENTTLLKPLEAYWIYSDDFNEILLGYNSEPTTPPIKHLYHGWNTIGLGSSYPMIADQALAPIQNKWTLVLQFDNSLQMYRPPISPGDTETALNPGKGYWIYMKEEGEIVGFS